MNDDELDFQRLACSSSTSFGRCIVELTAGEALRHEAALWQHAIVFVVGGEVEVRCSSGECHRFVRGDVLSLARLHVEAVRSTAAAPTRLLAIWRRTGTDEITG